MTLPLLHAAGGLLVRKGRPPIAALSEFARREALTVGSYFPDETNTGLLNDPARPLTVWDGDYTANVAGAKIADLEIRGRVIVSADNVTVDNCWIRGPATAPSGSDIGMVSVTNPTRNALFRDCYLDPRAPGARMDGFRFAGYTAKRCRVRRVVDGFGAFNATAGSNGPANVAVLGCWLESMTKFYPDEGIHSDGTHNDGLHVQGGTNIVLRGSRLHGKVDPDTGNTGGLNVGSGGATLTPPCTQSNAIVQLNGSINPIGLVVEDNWFFGGLLGVNGLGLTSASYVTSMTFQRNRFDRDQYFALPSSGRIAVGSAVTMTCPLTGADANVYMDDLSPVPVRRS